MSIVFRKIFVVILLFSVLVTQACLKEKHTVPSISTKDVIEITSFSAISGGEITNTGGLNIISRGVCWDTAGSTAEQINSTNEAGDLQSFTCNINDLKPHTKYYVRAYAANSIGTGYGDTISFTTLGEVPTAVTLAPSDITLTSATLNGNVNPNHLSTSVTFEYGTTIDYGNNIIAIQNPVAGDSVSRVSISLTGLTAGTDYNFRIKTINDLGTTYGENLTFKTLLPEVNTLPATDIKTTSAILNGLVNPHGLNSSLVFMFGQDIPPYNQVTYNYSSAAIPSATNAYEDTPIISNLTGLKPGTMYHYYLKMDNDLGTFSGYEYRFTTLPITVITNEPTHISETSVTLNGVVNANNSNISVAFEYGVYPFGFWNSESGTLIHGTPSQVSGNTNTPVSVTISGLLPGKRYSYFFEAEGQGWSVRGNPKDITTKNIIFNPDLNYGTMSDIDGNDYRTIQIGSQIWMAENLKTTQYNDGTQIPEWTRNTELNTASYKWFGNRGDYLADYGAMYNWYVVNTGKVCPVGWHVPSYDEWSQLVTYSGGETSAGGKLKETGTTHWNSPNTGADNSTGFTAVGAGNNEDMAGLTDPGGTPWNLKSLTYLWTQNESKVLRLYSNSSAAGFYQYSQRYHCSIRCLKD
jgi:uncharacterized protein (TIGR02145 family)